jgi:hypothetical protein
VRGRLSATKPRFVVLLPITHSLPIGDTVAIEIPAKVRRPMGLDDERSWVVVSEYNASAVQCNRGAPREG